METRTGPKCDRSKLKTRGWRENCLEDMTVLEVRTKRIALSIRLKIFAKTKCYNLKVIGADTRQLYSENS